MTRSERVAVRESSRREPVDEWALVLAAMGVDSTVSSHHSAWELQVDASDAGKAREALDAYDQEQRPAVAPIETSLPDWGPTRAGVTTGLLLMVFYVAIDGHAVWYRMGRLMGGSLLAGEWWRTFTALSLHANLAHVMGNAVACAIFLTAVCRLTGPGVGIWLAVLAGTGANAVNSLLRPPSYGSLGASTAIFGCLGVLTGYQFLRRRRMSRHRGRSWLPVAAGLALLGWLGTGPESDLAGHFLGFLFGSFFGLLLGFDSFKPPPRSVQNALVVAAAVVMSSCWILAFQLGPVQP